MTEKLESWSALALAEAVRSGNLTATEVAHHFLERIASLDENIQAFLNVNKEEVNARASHLDEKRRNGQTLGKLAGVPVAVKDNICTMGATTTCGSRILENYVPPYHAHVIERILAEDAVILGKTNMDEFGMGSSTENSAFQTTRNPWNLERIPGGSSGGSAAAVAARMAPLALGSDTGGSIRQPASVCGVVGLKPTYGRVSRYGLVAFGSSLEQIGPFARTTEDAALLLEVIAGHDGRDSTSANLPSQSYSLSNEGIENLVVGVPQSYLQEKGLDEEVRGRVQDAISFYQQSGATIVSVELPYTHEAIAAYYLIAPAEASSNLARYDGVHYGHRSQQFSNLIDMTTKSRTEGFGDEVKRRIMLGTFALSSGRQDAYYQKAMKIRRLIKESFDTAFRKCQVIISPTCPQPAFAIGEKTEDPLAMYLSDIFTIGANMAGIPAINIPCGFSKEGLPVGMQLLAPAFAEDGLLNAAHIYERAHHWKDRSPANM